MGNKSVRVCEDKGLHHMNGEDICVWKSFFALTNRLPLN
jgi:hypothetical protein